MNQKTNLFPLTMKLTAALTASATVLLAVASRFLSWGWLLPCAISCGTVCYHFSMRLAVGAMVPLFTGKCDPEHSWFRQRKIERKLYRFLGVKHWKQKLPTYDPSQFDLERHGLGQVIHNMCNAEIVHEVIIVFSWVPLLFAIPFGEFPVFLITSALAALFDSSFVMIQRYNRPRLMRILKKKEAKACE